MADQLATKDDLEHLLQRTGIPTETATVVLEAVTAVVQAAARQRLVAVVDDPFEVDGTTDQLLRLPERPITAVSAVSLDGWALTFGADLKRVRAGLWRRDGWMTCADTPSTVTGMYSHGYDSDNQALQLARAAVLGIARGIIPNPSGATSLAIDDYRVAYEAALAAMEGSPALQASLRRQYGRKAGMVRIG